MDFSKFRQTGELSDINVMVNGKEFKLHKFPLFIKSDFFRTLAQSQHGEQDCIQLDEFPGGPESFELVANYCYNVRIDITKENACELRCAAEFLQMNSPGNLASTIDRYLQDILTSAKLGRNLGTIIDLVLQCEKLGPIAEQAKIVDKCLLSVVDCWLLSTKFTKRLQTDSITSDKESFKKLCQLPLNWFLQLFVTARDKSVKPFVLANMVQMYISHAMETQTTSSNTEKSKKRKAKKAEVIKPPIPAVKKNAIAEDQQNETDEVKALEKTGSEEETDNKEDEKSVPNETKREEDDEGGDDDNEKSETDKVTDEAEVPAAEKNDEEGIVEKEEGIVVEPAVEKDEEEAVDDEKEEGEEEEEEGAIVPDEIDPRIGEIMDVLLLELPDNAPLAETISPQWAATMLATAEKLGCKCRPMLLKVAGRLLHRISPDDLATFNPALLSEIVEEACKDSHRVESQLMCGVIDNYLLALAEKDELNVDIFTRMVSSVPRDKRVNHDTLFMTLESLLQSEKISVTEEEKQELMETVDFSRLSESTLQRAYDSQLVPGAYITKAALTLCAKLRAELDATRATVKAQDEQLARFGLGSKSMIVPSASRTRTSHEADSRLDQSPAFNPDDSLLVEHEAWVDDLRSELKEHLRGCSLLSHDQRKPAVKSTPTTHSTSKGVSPDNRMPRKPSTKSRRSKKARGSRHADRDKKSVSRKSHRSRMAEDDVYGAILEVNTTESEEDDPTYVSTMTEYYELSALDSDNKYTKPYKKVTWPKTALEQTKLFAGGKPSVAATKSPRKVISQTYNVHNMGDLTKPASKPDTTHRWVTDDFGSQYWYRVEIEKCAPGEPITPRRTDSSATSSTTPNQPKYKGVRRKQSDKKAREYNRPHFLGNRAYAPSDWQDTISHTYESLMTDDYKLMTAYGKSASNYVEPGPTEYSRYDYTPSYEPSYSDSTGGHSGYIDRYKTYLDSSPSPYYDVYSPSGKYISGNCGSGGSYYRTRPTKADVEFSSDYIDQDSLYSPLHGSADDIPSFFVYDTSDYNQYPLSRTNQETDVNLREWKSILQEVKYWREYVSNIIR